MFGPDVPNKLEPGGRTSPTSSLALKDKKLPPRSSYGSMKELESEPCGRHGVTLPQATPQHTGDVSRQLRHLGPMSPEEGTPG